MLKKINKIVFIVMFLICSCATKYNKDEANFYNRLEKNYRNYADYKKGNYDWRGARLFYKKANLIKKGKEVQPENPPTKLNVYNYLTKNISYIDFEDGRERMMFILESPNIKENYPEETADLQFYYDCWVMEEELYRRFSQISRCKDNFYSTLNKLEYDNIKLTSTEIELLKFELDGKEYEPFYYVKPKYFVVYFDFDSSAINSDGARVLRSFINEIDKAKDSGKKFEINISGHADRVGALKYNERLSKRRVDTVKHYLLKNGVNKDLLKVKWKGEIDPRVLTEQNFKEGVNRRVSMTIKMLE